MASRYSLATLALQAPGVLQLLHPLKCHLPQPPAIESLPVSHDCEAQREKTGGDSGHMHLNRGAMSFPEELTLQLITSLSHLNSFQGVLLYYTYNCLFR
jgi:hypothetical protein